MLGYKSNPKQIRNPLETKENPVFGTNLASRPNNNCAIPFYGQAEKTDTK